MVFSNLGITSVPRKFDLAIAIDCASSTPSQESIGHRQLAERGLLLVLPGPGGDRQPVVLEVEVARVQQKTSQLPLCLDVKVGELDHRHFGAGLSFELMNVV